MVTVPSTGRPSLPASIASRTRRMGAYSRRWLIMASVLPARARGPDHRVAVLERGGERLLDDRVGARAERRVVTEACAGCGVATTTASTPAPTISSTLVKGLTPYCSPNARAFAASRPHTATNSDSGIERERLGVDVGDLPVADDRRLELVHGRPQGFRITFMSPRSFR